MIQKKRETAWKKGISDSKLWTNSAILKSATISRKLAWSQYLKHAKVWKLKHRDKLVSRKLKPTWSSWYRTIATLSLIAGKKQWIGKSRLFKSVKRERIRRTALLACIKSSKLRSKSATLKSATISRKLAWSHYLKHAKVWKLKHRDKLVSRKLKPTWISW
jgi:hypothetical protein